MDIVNCRITQPPPRPRPMKKQIWKRLRHYIQKAKVGDKLKRRYILKHVYGRSGGNSMQYWTMDVYISHLITVKVLKRMNRGNYEKLRDIPEGMNSSKLKQMATDKSWRVWFMTEEDRLDLN